MGNKQARIYCGNNGAATNNKPVGTRHQCMKVGIGKGLRLSCDNSYNGPYQPIDGRKIYCGNSPNLPANYDIMGSPSMCLRKGIGLGKVLRARKGCKSWKLKALFSCIWLFLSLAWFLYTYLYRPSFVLTDDKKQLDTRKIAIYNSSVIIVLLIICLIVYNFI